VTARVCVGSYPSSVSQDQSRQPSSTHGEVASVEAEFSARCPGLKGADRPAPAGLDLLEVESQPAPMQMPSASPVWADGTLPGIMAGKRPAPRPIRSI
jgi:hypothetical protein